LFWWCRPSSFPATEQQLIDDWKQGRRWIVYGRQFDLRNVQRLAAAADHRGCLALVDSLFADASSLQPEERFYARSLRASALVGLGDYEAGIEEYRKLASEAVTPE